MSSSILAQSGARVSGAVTRPRYLFIRLLEACNAGCFMCGFARSTDSARFSVQEFEQLLPSARQAGVQFVRFTGGEPLVHTQVLTLIETGRRAGMRISLITNGLQLPRKVDGLAASGLEHLIVSIDGATALTHDTYRDSPHCFDRAVAGLRRAVALGITTRVNTVVGPHNYREMPALQQVLLDIGVHQWELSALKLPRAMPAYDDPASAVAVGETVYGNARLRPNGKRWYGDTAEEMKRYFVDGIPPRASGPVCHVVSDVLYLDARNSTVYVCSCLPHRKGHESSGAEYVPAAAPTALSTAGIEDLRRYFAVYGPTSCTGCSATASGYSDRVAADGAVADWAY